MVPSHWIQKRLDAVTLTATESHKDPSTATTERLSDTAGLFDIYLTFYRTQTQHQKALARFEKKKTTTKKQVLLCLCG